MLAWSEGSPDTPAPVSDTAKRSEVEAKLIAARAQSRAGDGATASVSSQVEKVSAAIRAISARIEQAAATVVVEEAEKLFPELADAIAALKPCEAASSLLATSC
ncbi:MAG: hypothetical protein WCF81_18545 [Roseiarcus sp.]